MLGLRWVVHVLLSLRVSVMTRRHGVGKEGVEAILAAQNGGCAICHVLYEDRPGARLAMDHDHAHCPGLKGCAVCVRGMLCNRCNNLLRLAGDNTALLAEAINYLARWSHRPLVAITSEVPSDART